MFFSTKILVVVALCLNAVLAVSLNANLGMAKSLWSKFKETHDKKYETPELESLRFSLFKRNLEKIEKHNEEYAKGLQTYRLGVNQFADMTVEEFSQFLGYRANMTINPNGSSGRFLRASPFLQLPNSTDWRQNGAVTPVKDQGQCGSCWAFSTTGSLEAAHFRLTGQLVSLSEQQLVDCSAKYNNNGCNGGLMDNAFQYVKENQGLDTESSYPYHAKQEKCHFSKKTIGSTCSGFVDIESGNEEALREAVATIGPVSVAIDVTQDNFMLYKDGVFVDPTCQSDADHLDHGVLVVGYGTDDSNGTPQDFWIVKNSWSEKWGENGYIRMARNQNNMCGISTSASYPLVKASDVNKL